MFGLPLYAIVGAMSPVVSSITDNVGDTAGGVPITITGSRFTGATGATIGGVSITSFSVVNDTTITGVTGARAKGVVDVAVTGPSGTGTLTSGYEYWNPTSVTACVWWLRADLGVTVNGTPAVTAWADQSSAGDSNRNVAPVGTAPAYTSSDASYNNRATIGPFDAAPDTDDIRLINAAAWSASYSTFTLGAIGHSKDTTNLYWTYGSAANYCALVGRPSGGSAFGGNATNELNSGAPVTAAKSLLMAEFNGASSKIFVDATSTATNTGTLDATSLGANAMSVGSHPITNLSATKIAEIFGFDGILSANDKVKLRKYLNGRYSKSMTA